MRNRFCPSIIFAAAFLEGVLALWRSMAKPPRHFASRIYLVDVASTLEVVFCLVGPGAPQFLPSGALVAAGLVGCRLQFTWI